jgi:hypothetical protein
LSEILRMPQNHTPRAKSQLPTISCTSDKSITSFIMNQPESGQLIGQVIGQVIDRVKGHVRGQVTDQDICQVTGQL